MYLKVVRGNAGTWTPLNTFLESEFARFIEKEIREHGMVTLCLDSEKESLSNVSLDGFEEEQEHRAEQHRTQFDELEGSCYDENERR